MTVLGPLLFLCHINDLLDAVRATVWLFADHCLLYRQIKSREDHISFQQDLQSLETWAKAWGMCCNTKTYYTMSINSKSTHFYQLDGHILQQGPENPYLCVTISNDLKWSSHIKKTNSTLGFLKRNLKHCPLNCMMTAYISLIRSTLECSLVIWDTYFQKDIDKLEKFYARLPDSFQETTL